MVQDPAKVDVAALTDAEQLRLTSGRILTWHDAEARCELSPLAKRRRLDVAGNLDAAENYFRLCKSTSQFVTSQLATGETEPRYYAVGCPATLHWVCIPSNKV